MNARTDEAKGARAPSHRLWLGLILTYLLIPSILLVCGGDFGWWQGWAYAVLIFTAGIGARLAAEKRHPGLLVERITSEKALLKRATPEKATAAKPWDRMLSPLMGLSLTFPLVIVAGLDHRFGWSPVFPLWLNIIGLVLIAAGYAFAAWALAENQFFSGTVRIQTDRGHVVCDSGPYRIVRHPGYAGNLLPLAGMILAFSSVWTLIPAAVALVIAVIRTALEDRTLQEELPGYRDYARRVRYRLLPGVY